MTREEFIKQRCEIDKITEEEFKKRYRVVKCNRGQPYCKGYRCLDLDGLLRENQKLKDKLSKIETLIINHNCDTGDIYYKYNSKFLKSELKQRILEIVYEEESRE